MTQEEGDDVLGGKGAELANAFLRKRVAEMAKRPTPATPAAFEVERTRRKKELLRSLGLDPMPPKTPLNARVTGTIRRDGYRMEKVVFESRPKFYVTCHVYVPDPPAQEKLPVIVHVNGHWPHKKGEDLLQIRGAFCALQGYLAILVDSPGWSFEGDSLIERRAEGTHNDPALAAGANTTGYYVWDTIRALDYLATRPDADVDRAGLTGASGGGLTTLYTFAADDRYSAAVPVVYMASLELAFDNGCLCNHVPGTLQVGDRSDVLAVQAPKPVYLMGAQDDDEFPPEAMNLTYQKLQPAWSLFGRQEDTYVRIFEGPHSYNKPMREAMIGFFNRYVKDEGDGSPVAEPAIEVIDSEDRQLLVLDPAPGDERTMRELSLESLAGASEEATAERYIAVNGGLPPRTELHLEASGEGTRKEITFEAEPGLRTPGVLYLPPKGTPSMMRIVVDDAGKTAAIAADGAREQGAAYLCLDILGTGELAGIELRYPLYMGRSVAFIGGWQLVRAIEAMSGYTSNVELLGNGPISSQAVMAAALIDPSVRRVVGTGCLRSWADVFDPSVSPLAVQPRAHLCGALDSLRELVKNGRWEIGPEKAGDQ